ncbi:hypothetical protein CSOJ01_01061 [Colletotrichum sojae]|uniref:SnoaL-like domain-containing protein n=1 Tax=Colletotrichum sojae TaxID=2175907 RepID=A0A8H6N543_9PEZI|nr:hypothetical protein CSOJ01_01061 [Colletotrichum sojae]
MSIPPYEVAETIRRNKARYCHWSDTLRYDLFSRVALPDAKFDFVDREGQVLTMNGVVHSFPDLDSFCKHFTAANTGIDAFHVIDPGAMEMVSEDEVKAVFGVTFGIGARGSDDGLAIAGAGQYHEVWKKVEGEWFIASLRMMRLHWKAQVISA